MTERQRLENVIMMVFGWSPADFQGLSTQMLRYIVQMLVAQRFQKRLGAILVG